MANPGRILVLFVATALALTGVIAGASLQHEEILHTQLQDADQAADRIATGNLIPLTALLVAIGASLAVAILGTARRRRRTLGALAVGLSAYVLIQLVQTAWPNYLIVEDSVTLSLSLLASNATAVPSLLMPVLALVASCLWIVVWGGRTALGAQPGRDLHALQRRHLGRVLYAAPFLIIACWGPIKLMLALPPGDPAMVGHYLLLGFQALNALGLIVVLVLQQWHLATGASEPRLKPYAADAWLGLRTVHMILLGILLALPFAAPLLPGIELPELQSGFVFGASLRSHEVMMAALLLPLLPAALLGRDIRVALLAPTAEADASAVAPAGAKIVFTAAVSAAWVGAGITTFLAAGALWPWLVATGICLTASRLSSPASRAIQLSFAAYIVWAIGNTITAGFIQATDVTIRYGTHPGILALWRILAVVLAAAAWTTLLVGARSIPRPRAVGLAIGASIGLGLAVLVELPLWAWTIQSLGGEAVGLGSLPSSQDAAVRSIMHLIAVLGTCAAAWLTGQIHAPAWFRKAKARTA